MVAIHEASTNILYRETRRTNHPYTSISKFLAVKTFELVTSPILMALSPKHHGELNDKLPTVKKLREMRRLYRNDKVALQEIDVYDENPMFRQLFDQWLEAKRNNNNKLADSIFRKLKRKYPDV